MRIILTIISRSVSDDAYDEGEDTEAHLEGIQKLPNGGYRLKLPIPPVFFKYIIGKEGRTKKGIERDTECHLWLPSKGKEGDVGKKQSFQTSNVVYVCVCDN